MEMIHEDTLSEVDQWNRIKKEEIDPHLYTQLISDWGEKAFQWRKNSIFNKWINGAKQLKIYRQKYKIKVTMTDASYVLQKLTQNASQVYM